MDRRRKRLLFRARHMGTAENDVIFGAFAAAALPGMGEVELDQFEALLAAADPDLYAWATGAAFPPAEHDHAVMARLRAYVTGSPRE